jgi:hypothetical protein
MAGTSPAMTRRVRASRYGGNAKRRGVVPFLAQHPVDGGALEHPAVMGQLL